MDTKGNKSNDRRLYQAEPKNPDQWDRDLNPNHMQGQNIGPDSDMQETGNRTAYDIKEIHRALNLLSDDELKMIPVLPPGARLQQGATYIDLQPDAPDTPPQEFKATGDIIADRENFFIPKDQVPYPLWNRLIGEPKPGQERRTQ
jgi:hypothetical protein